MVPASISTHASSLAAKTLAPDTSALNTASNGTADTALNNSAAVSHTDVVNHHAPSINNIVPLDKVA